MKIVWIPEAPHYTNTYAIEKKPGSNTNCTSDVYKALQFSSIEECLAWCNAHPSPVFVPVEHQFADSVFRHENCIYRYCPHPEVCKKNGCQFPTNHEGLN